MLRYQPPKSSVWGHGLRRMPAQRARTLFREFLDRSVAEYRFSSAMLSVHDDSGQVRSRYERLLGIVSRGGYFDGLSEEQCDRCIERLIEDEASEPAAAACLMLSQSFELLGWRIGGGEAATKSLLTMHYGQLRHLTTFLQFESVEQFQAVRRVLAEIGLCKLDERHLKPTKSKAR